MDNPELAMMALVIIILILIFAVIWFVFMVPMEKGLHKRRMELIQRRLRENEERLRREREAEAAKEHADDQLRD